MSKVRVFQDAKEKTRRGAKACPWSVEWYDNGKRRSRSIGTRQQAKDFAAVKQAELVQRRSGLTVEKTWDEFVAEYDSNVIAAMRSERSQIETRRMLKLFGSVMHPRHVSGINKLALDEYKVKRLKAPGKKPESTLSPESVRKELRTIRAALSVAVDWGYLAAVPPMPKVDGFGLEKRFVSQEHFLAMLATLENTPDVVTMPSPAKHRQFPGRPADWWAALLWYLWATGQRIGATLELRWEDVDLKAGVVLSRAQHNKQKKDQRVHIAVIADVLAGIRGFGPLVFPWGHDVTTLHNEFHRLQVAAGIQLVCRGEHQHTDACHVYGFHDFRRAHATLNFGRVSNKDLQSQMGHASFATTERYIKYAEQQQQHGYDAFLPVAPRRLTGTA